MSAALNRCRLVEHALLRQEVERLPCFPLVDVVYAAGFSGVSLAQAQLEPALHARALGQCLERLPIDGVYVNLCFSRRQASQAMFREGRYHLLLDECLDLDFGADEVASVARTRIASLDDPRIARAELFHPGMLETYRAIPEEVLQQAAVCAGLTGAFSQLGFLFGLEKLLVAMVDQPEQVHQAIQCRQEVALRQAEELCRAGARYVWIGEGMASGSLIGPAMYRQFVLPYQQELTAWIRRLGGLSLLHVCGNNSKTLREIAATGADGCDVDSPTDWAAAWETLGTTMCLKGNISPLLFLPENSALLPEACEEAIRIAAGRRGFILSTGCLVPRDASAEAFGVFARVCNRRGAR